MKIIENHLEKALRVTTDTYVKQQGRRGARRRGGNSKGVVVHSKWVGVRIPPDLYEHLEYVCDKVQIERATLIRAALEFYLGMAEQEGLTQPTKRVPTKLRNTSRSKPR